MVRLRYKSLAIMQFKQEVVLNISSYKRVKPAPIFQTVTEEPSMVPSNVVYLSMKGTENHLRQMLVTVMT